MASSKVEDGHKLLEKYKAAFAAHGEFFELARSLYEETKPDLINKRLTFVTLVTQIKCVEKLMEDIHHAIGHGWFDACWQSTPVGKEFEPGSGGADSLASAVLEELFSGSQFNVQELDPDNLPPDMPDDLKKAIKAHHKAHQQAQTNAKNAHLH